MPSVVDPLDRLIGDSPAIHAVRRAARHLIERAQRSSRMPSVLILGETGTGKGLLARALHDIGPRQSQAFVTVNCAAIPDNLLEAELFGYERGAFTDARHEKLGLFQAADRGTLFLDELGALPLPLQAKLLTALEERTVRRLGRVREERVDVWVLAATGEDLTVAIRERRFREDLYHRVSAVTMTLPPLRQRAGDVLALAEHFLARASSEYGLARQSLDPAASAALAGYSWPGNVRELANVIERSALLSDASTITAPSLCLGGERSADAPADDPVGPGSHRDTLVEFERRQVLAALEATAWNLTDAARSLGLPRNTLRYRLERLGLTARPQTPAGRLGAGSPVRSDPRSTRAPDPDERPAAADPAPATSPARLTEPDHALRWERRRVSVLGVRVGGGDEPAPRSTAARAMELVVGKVTAFGGRVQELDPITLMAAFGLDPLEDGAYRAARTAMAIRAATERWNATSGEGPTRLVVGVHATEALIARIGRRAEIARESKESLWREMLALLDHARSDDVVLSPEAGRLLKRRFHIDSASTAVPTLGRERSDTDVLMTAPPLVGRADSLAVLGIALDELARGIGRVIEIVGDAGIGKSRLWLEFRRRLVPLGLPVLEVQASSSGAAAPYLVAVELLQRMFALAESDGPVDIRKKIEARLARCGITPSVAAPYVLSFLGIRPDGAEPLAPETIRLRTLDLCPRVLANIAGADGAVVVIEDVHWLDRASEHYLAALAEVAGTAAVLLIVTARPGYEPPWRDRSRVTRLGLGSLGPADSRVLLDALLPPTPENGPVAETILQRAEGNPFFLEEMARAAKGHAGAGPAAEVPHTIDEAISGRVAALSPVERSVVEAAAVTGREASLNLLGSMVDLPLAECRQAAATLEQVGFLRRDQERYRLAHPLFQEVIYRCLIDADRRALHLAALAQLEAQGRRDDVDHTQRLAHHAVRGGAWPRAVGYLRDAARSAFDRSANREAVAYLEEAVAALARMADDRDVQRQAVDLRFELRHALWALGQMERGIGYLQAAQPIVERLGDSRRAVRLLAHLAGNHLVLGDNARAKETGEQAVATLELIDEPGIRVDVNQLFGVLYTCLGEYRRALGHLDRNMALLDAAAPAGRFHDFYRVHGLAWSAWARCELGELTEAAGVAAAAWTVAARTDYPHNLVAARWIGGYVRCAQGDALGAAAILEAGFALCRAAEIVIWHRPTAALLGRAYTLAGRPDEGVRMLESSLAPSENNVGLSNWQAYLAEAYLLVGRVAEARDVAEAAVARARQHGERGFEAHAIRVLAAAYRRLGDHEEAALSYGQARALAEQLGMRSLMERCGRELDGG